MLMIREPCKIARIKTTIMDLIIFTLPTCFKIEGTLDQESGSNNNNNTIPVLYCMMRCEAMLPDCRGQNLTSI